ncbi:MAG: MFS transporter [Rhizobiaceae bacterium]
MATQVRHPIWLPAVRSPGRRTFALLYAIESFARASVASVVPIQAYDLLRDEQAVSVLYTLVSIAGLSVTLFMPMLIARFARRWVYTAGAVALAAGSVAFVTETMAGQVIGMFLRIAGASALSITLNLYIMDHIRKTEFVAAESLRLAWSTLGWTAGPAFGVMLYANVGLPAAHGMAAFFAFVLLGFFWYFRLGDNQLIRPGKLRPANPLANIGRFVMQPRLRLAWLIAFGRSCFWTTLFVYGPILMVVTGQGELAGGLLVSAGNALLFTALVWGWVAGKVGARLTMGLCFLAMAVTLVAAGMAGETYPLLAASLLLVCTFFAISLDALGSTAFMRAVRSYERPQMTAVYRTYLDLSDLLPPLVYSIVLAFFDLGAVFIALAVLCLGCGLVTLRYVPRSM